MSFRIVDLQVMVVMAWFTLAPAATAEWLEVDQKVFGMD